MSIIHPEPTPTERAAALQLARAIAARTGRPVDTEQLAVLAELCARVVDAIAGAVR